MLIDDGAVLYRHVKTAEGRDEGAQRYMFVIETRFLVFHILSVNVISLRFR